MKYIKEKGGTTIYVGDISKVNEMKKVYLADDFKLMGAYEIDYLLIVMTVTMLCERYSLTV